MALTAAQTTAINTQLSVNLSTVTADRLIELCLLYRSAPSVLPSFKTALDAEITRRFTAAEIAANDVMFSVISNFSNQFNPDLQYKEKMYEYVNALDRQLWLTQNMTFFEQTLEISDRMTWVVSESIVVSALVSSSSAMTKIAASSVAMTKIAASSTAMTAVAASSVALSKIVVSTVARNALMANNTVFQSFKSQMMSTVVASWTKQASLFQNTPRDSPLTNINTAVASPQGFVFARLGWAGSFTTGKSEAKHPDGTIAVTAGTISNPTSVSSANVDVVTLNGATFTARIDYAQAYAELWIPPTI